MRNVAEPWDPSSPKPSLSKELGKLGVPVITALKKQGAKKPGTVALFKNQWMRISGGMAHDGVGSRPFSNKQLVKEKLEGYGFLVAASKLFTKEEVDGALSFFEAKSSAAVVIKPPNGLKGKGVVTNITKKQELAEEIKSIYSNEFIIEEHVPGNDYRLLVVGGNLVAATCRLPAHVHGDGVKTIAQLIDHKNTKRKLNLNLRNSLIQMDAATMRHLEKQSLDFEAIPGCGEYISLRGAANISSGGENIDVTDVLHPFYSELAEKVANKIGKKNNIIGVDIITNSIEAEPNVGECAIIELNGKPSLLHHLSPAKGQGRNVYRPIAEHLVQVYGSPSKKIIKRKFRCYGSVQGVGFRKFIKTTVENAGCTCQARNLKDGSVEITVTGWDRVVDHVIMQAFNPFSGRTDKILFMGRPAQGIHKRALKKLKRLVKERL